MSITWREIKEALDGMNPEQLAKPANVFQWDGRPGNDWPYNTGRPVEALQIGTADEVHECGHTYPLDAVVLVVGPQKTVA